MKKLLEFYRTCRVMTYMATQHECHEFGKLQTEEEFNERLSNNRIKALAWDTETDIFIQGCGEDMTKLIDLYRQARAQLFAATKFHKPHDRQWEDEAEEEARNKRNKEVRKQWDEETEDNIRKALS
jgi:hypothetical protein